MLFNLSTKKQGQGYILLLVSNTLGNIMTPSYTHTLRGCVCVCVGGCQSAVESALLHCLFQILSGSLSPPLTSLAIIISKITITLNMFYS